MFDGTQSVSFADQYRGECFGNIEWCYYGFTYTFWLYMYGDGNGGGSAYAGDGIQGYFVMSNGGQTSASWGIAISYQGLVLNVIAQSRDQTWGPIQYTAAAAGWYYVTITWHSAQGFFLYINGIAYQSAQSQIRTSYVQSTQFNNFYFGRPNDVAGSYGIMIMDEFWFYNTFQSADWIYNLYLTYLSEYTTHI